MKRWFHLGRLESGRGLSIPPKTVPARHVSTLFWVLVAALVTVLVHFGYQATGRAVEPLATADVAVGNLWHEASFPVENFQAYTSPFGYRSDPYGGSQRFHYGLDMAAPMGSYIRNWWDGQVIEVSDDSSCGTSVVVQSGNWMHIYCHMQGHVVTEGGGRYMVDNGGNLRIREGQAVGTGTRIGRIGMTGRTTGPHLHWGMKYDENWVDPALVLHAMYSSQQVSAREN
ncbi:MAG: M23 family metallopeptidase [Leptolyngbyaceae cyanobacterium]